MSNPRDPSITPQQHPTGWGGKEELLRLGFRYSSPRMALQRRDCIAQSFTNGSGTLEVTKPTGEGQEEEHGHQKLPALARRGPRQDHRDTAPRQDTAEQWPSAKFIPTPPFKTGVIDKWRHLPPTADLTCPSSITGAEHGSGDAPRALLPNCQGRAEDSLPQVFSYQRAVF